MSTCSGWAGASTGSGRRTGSAIPRPRSPSSRRPTRTRSTTPAPSPNRSPSPDSGAAAGVVPGSARGPGLPPGRGQHPGRGQPPEPWPGPGPDRLCPWQARQPGVVEASIDLPDRRAAPSAGPETSRHSGARCFYAVVKVRPAGIRASCIRPMSMAPGIALRLREQRAAAGRRSGSSAGRAHRPDAGFRDCLRRSWRSDSEVLAAGQRHRSCLTFSTAGSSRLAAPRCSPWSCPVRHLIAFPFSLEKSTNAMSVPSATNSVCEPSTKDGSQDVRRDRLTTTWNDPLAASYLLSELIDLSSTGELRSTVVSANGFLNWGRRCTVDSASTSAMTAARSDRHQLVTRLSRDFLLRQDRTIRLVHSGIRSVSSARSVLTVRDGPSCASILPPLTPAHRARVIRRQLPPGVAAKHRARMVQRPFRAPDRPISVSGVSLT